MGFQVGVNVTLFTANYVYGNEVDGVLIAGMADDQFETTRYVLFQKSLNPTADDVALGFDRVHIALDDAENGVYGELVSVVLNAACLQVGVDAATSAALGVDKTFTVALSSSVTGLEPFVLMLEAMTDTFVDAR